MTMQTIHREYVIDGNGNKKAVLVPLSEWELILEALEELDDIQAYDEAKPQASDPIPFDQAVDELKRGISN
jgi:PHD/YefM family antitoxin component YafN of YafNO toxin-antitoxin module